MSPVGFKKLQCPLSKFLNVPVDFKVVQCRLSNLRRCHVALSNLRVKSPYSGALIYAPYSSQQWPSISCGQKIVAQKLFSLFLPLTNGHCLTRPAATVFGF